jgi:hypothetical protein
VTVVIGDPANELAYAGNDLDLLLVLTRGAKTDADDVDVDVALAAVQTA